MALQSEKEREIQRLLGFISHIAVKPEVSEKRLIDNYEPTDSFVGTGTLSDKQRLAPVLDSLANLCVASARHEVVAIAMSYSKPHGVKIFISTNDDTPQETVQHLRYMWSTLRILAGIHQKHHSARPASKISPPKPKPESLPNQGANLEREFWRNAIRFGWLKIERRIQEKFDKLAAVKYKDLKQENPLRRIIDLIQDIQSDFFKKGKKKPDTPERWDMLSGALKVLQSYVDALFKRGGIPAAEFRRIPPNFKLERYLLKLVSIIKDISVLFGVANSPRCRLAFDAPFDIVPVRNIQAYGGPHFPMPQTTDQWMQVVVDALRERNRTNTEAEPVLEIIPHVVRNDCVAMSDNAVKAMNVVHCECSLIAFLLAAEAKGMPRTYSYIGISKPSCCGCNHFIGAVNVVHNRRFVTKGCHRKAYYSWRFPRILGADDIADKLYSELAWTFARTYEGFRVKTKEILSDSEGQTVSPRLETEDSVFRNAYEKWRAGVRSRSRG